MDIKEDLDGIMMRPTFQYRRRHQPSSSATTVSTSSLTCSSNAVSSDDLLIKSAGSSSVQVESGLLPPDADTMDQGGLDVGLSEDLQFGESIREQARILQQIQERIAMSTASSARPVRNAISRGGPESVSASSSARSDREARPPSCTSRVPQDDRSHSHSLREYLQETTARLQERTTRSAALASLVHDSYDGDVDDWARHTPCQRRHQRQPAASPHNLALCEEDTWRMPDANGTVQGNIEASLRAPHASAAAAAVASTTSMDHGDGPSATAGAATKVISNHHRRPAGITEMDKRKDGHNAGSYSGNPEKSASRDGRTRHPRNMTRKNGGITKDQVILVGSKTALRVRSPGHTYDAIARGTAILVQCAACKAVLQIDSSAKLLYCSLCQNVTPVDLAREQQTIVTNPGMRMAPSVGASTEVASSSRHNDRPSDIFRMDSSIAHAMQNQEMDVAYARKLATMHQQVRNQSS
jgi:LSD1 subclass zinc finger protein